MCIRDRSNLRRGIKSANIIWGNEASVLAGDFLFAQSFDLMVETKSLKALSVLAQASCKITQGVSSAASDVYKRQRG